MQGRRVRGRRLVASMVDAFRRRAISLLIVGLKYFRIIYECITAVPNSPLRGTWTQLV